MCVFSSGRVFRLAILDDADRTVAMVPGVNIKWMVEQLEHFRDFCETFEGEQAKPATTANRNSFKAAEAAVQYALPTAAADSRSNRPEPALRGLRSAELHVENVELNEAGNRNPPGPRGLADQSGS